MLTNFLDTIWLNKINITSVAVHGTNVVITTHTGGIAETITKVYLTQEEAIAAVKKAMS